MRTDRGAQQAISKLSLPDVVGRGYGTFWRFRGRFRAVKGSRRSKKSKTMALETIIRIMQYPWANYLVVRKTYRTLKDSCFTELKWAIRRLGVESWWNIKEAPLELTYTPTGQKIYFRGLDDPLKVTSITTEVGVLSFMWIEEAYEITSEEDFDTLIESMMGELPEGAFRQITLTFNPWSEKTWIRRRFFCDLVGYDAQNRPIWKERDGLISADGSILAMTTNYMCNEWLSASDIEEFERMRERNPRRYSVAGLGHWGIVDGCIYENWREEEFDHKTPEWQRLHPGAVAVFGLDFGYTNDPTALFCGLLDKENKQLFVFDEMYEKGLSNKKIADNIKTMGYGKERIVADCAEPKSIDELNSMGLRVKGARKGRDSILNGIQWIQNLTIIVHPRCVNFITEMSNYTWDKDKFGQIINKPIDDFCHLGDAMRYSLEKYISEKRWLY